MNYPINTTERVDLVKPDFDTLVWQKGREVILEKSLLCPCKGDETDPQTNCKNCGGSGYIFINPTKTRMVLQSMSRNTKYGDWSEENMGMINITALEQDEIGFMDRITLLEGKSSFQEVLFFKQKNDKIFAYTAYPIKDMKYCGLFVSTSNKLQKLTYGTDFLYDSDIFILDNKYSDLEEPSVTIRYIHAPTFLILDMKRESMETFEYKVGEKLIRLPVSAVAKRAHYNLKKENLLGDRLLDNSYQEACIDYDQRNRIFTEQFTKQFS